MFRKLFKHLMGIDKTERYAHDSRNKATKDLLEIQHKVRMLKEYMESPTAFKIAKSTGRAE